MSARTFRFARSLLCLILASAVLVSPAPELASAAKKKNPPKVKVTLFVRSANGKVEAKMSGKAPTVTKKGKASKTVTLSFVKGSKVELAVTPKKGFKSGILLNGELVKFQSDKQAAAAAKPAPKVLNYNVKLPKTLVSGTGAANALEVRFVKKGERFAQDAGIVYSQLGSLVKVTNQNPGAVSGTAMSDVGITSVSWENLTTGEKGAASGKKNWSATIPFALGDNTIVAKMKAKDGSLFSNQTTITYHPAIDFNTPLNATDDVLFIGSPKAVTFSIGLSTPTGASVSLVETDASGVALAATPVPMLDNGTLPDEIDEDGVFTSRITLANDAVGSRYFRAQVQKADQTYFSEVKRIWIMAQLTQEQIQAAVDLANSVEDQYAALIASGKKPDAAAAAVVEAIKGLAIVGAAGYSDTGGIWWITADGILGNYHPTRSGQKGGEEGNVPPETYREFLAAVHDSSPKVENAALANFYAPAQLDFVKSGNINASAYATAASDNRVKSYKSLIISPYIANPDTTANFGSGDDYYKAWQYLTTNGSVCSQKVETERLNNGSVSITLEDFKSLADYGLVHISTHGDNFYNGLLSLWQDTWGATGDLKDYYSIVVLTTGIYLPKLSDGTVAPSAVAAHATDLAAKRIAINPRGRIDLLPAFFSHYLGHLPNSVVILSACRSARNSSMANAFLAKGAGAVYGYTDYVSTSYAQKTTQEIYERLLADDKTVQEAFDSAVANHGSNDADADPAYLTLFGDGTLKRSSGDLVNAGFEDGGLSPWTKSGDGRLISQLGSFSPQEGSFMGIVSTGLGYTTSAGSLSQSFCMAPNATTIDFKWNYSSAEFLEYCGSQYQDTFSVNLCEIDSQTGAETSCSVLLYKTVDYLCGSVFPVGFQLDRGGVYSTGWLSSSVPVPASMLGKSVKVRFSAGDVGDSIYDTAVLIDDVKIAVPTP